MITIATQYEGLLGPITFLGAIASGLALLALLATLLPERARARRPLTIASSLLALLALAAGGLGAWAAREHVGVAPAVVFLAGAVVLAWAARHTLRSGDPTGIAAAAGALVLLAAVLGTVGAVSVAGAAERSFAQFCALEARRGWAAAADYDLARRMMARTLLSSGLGVLAIIALWARRRDRQGRRLVAAAIAAGVLGAAVYLWVPEVDRASRAALETCERDTSFGMHLLEVHAAFQDGDARLACRRLESLSAAASALTHRRVIAEYNDLVARCARERR